MTRSYEIEALRDAMARVVRALEALRDGDVFFAEELLDDLAHDIWNMIEREASR
jgi:hypothetical protein